MNQKDKKSSQTVRKDIVKDIFSRPKPDKETISSIFTHFRHAPKIISPGPQEKSVQSSLKPLPAAIDIGASSIKLLQLAEGEKGELEIICIDEEGIGSGTSSVDSVKLAVKRIAGRNRIGPTCLTTLSAKDAQFYNMLFPPMPEEELGTAIRYKVMQLKPFETDTEKLVIRFSKWASGEVTKSSQQKIVIACVNKDVVEERVALLHEAGLRPVKIGLSPFDLINLSKFYKTGESRDAVTLWIDLGAENIFLAIEKGNTLCFSRKLTLTSRYMTKALAQYCRATEAQAEELKRKYGLILWSPDKKIPLFYEPGKPEEKKDDSEMVYHGLISHLENLVVDIMHSFKYFSYQVTQSQITRFDRIILCGGGAGLKNLDQFLSVRLGVPVERINPFSLFRLSDLIETRRRELIGASSDFALCAGLAIGYKISEARKLNFLPEEKKRTVEIFSGVLKKGQFVGAGVVILLALSLVFIQMGRVAYYKRQMNFLNNNVRSIKTQLGNMQATELNLSKEEAGLLSKKALLEARLNLVRGGLREPEDFSKRFASIAKLLPEEIWITRLRYKDGKLTITGSTNDMTLIARLIEDIKSCEEFMDADFNYSEKDPSREVFDFEIVADIKT